jgi:hypothetical protein
MNYVPVIEFKIWEKEESAETTFCDKAEIRLLIHRRIL